MKKILTSLIFLIVFIPTSLLSFSGGKDALFSSVAANNGREKILGLKIREALVNYHYRKLDINDDLSKKAFKEFIKKFDYGKQFFLQSDIKKLQRFEKDMDDMLANGDHQLLNSTVKIYEDRVKEADKMRKEIFKKPFTFDGNEELELDPDKRDFAKNKEQLKDHWRKVFKQSVLNRYVSYMEDAKEPKKDEKKSAKDSKKKKKEKKLTDKEMRAKAHKKINEKYERFFSRLLKEDRNDYLEKFYNSVTTIFDPHTEYFPPRKKEDFDIDISGSLEGIGAVLQEDGPYIKVVKIVPGGAAWRQKDLEVDDIILYVGQGAKEPVDLVDMRVDEAVRYIRGKKGTEVRLTVKKADGSRKVIPIIRDVVQIGASYAKGSVIQHKDLGIKVGYIHVPKFYRDFENNIRNCSYDVMKELERLKKSNIQGMILDLRNNGGGALEDARLMSGLFIDKGPIVQIRDHQNMIKVEADTDGKTVYNGPLIVMVNRFSASASEILAGAMQDYGRAVIVGGEYTHGKGTVQAVLDLNRGFYSSGNFGAIKVTLQKFYRVTGVSTQYKGVTPDIILPDPFGYTENREQDLENSLKWDVVDSKPFTPWKKYSYNLSKLKKNSKKRVKKDKRFSKIKKSVEYLVERKNKTKVSLNLKKVLAEDEKNEKIAKSLKIEDENKKILVSDYEQSLRQHEKIQKGDEAKWKKEFEQRKEEWVKNLRLDPMLEESLFIMNDIVKDLKDQKIGLVNK
ncbi:MAG: tail-specific protease [Oligoflexia bacterium]|nr:tail-specific protease [Oligoflexia bacterium]